MENELKRDILRLAGAAALLAAALIVSASGGWLPVALFIAAYLLAGADVLIMAVRNTLKGELFDENFLMGIATVGALVLGEYPEAVAVMLFYQVGELFQGFAIGKSRRSISELMDIRPDRAAVMRGGALIEVEPGDVAPGELIAVKPGERVPLDGIVRGGSSALDTSALTGESVPRGVEPGSEALSGCINLSGMLEIEVTKRLSESTVSRILELVESAGEKKAGQERFITRFAKIYTPIVVLLAVLLAVLPPLLIPGEAFREWAYRALTFLMVSCPCALVISVPLSFFGGIGGASAAGILIKGGNHLEALARAETVVFDKTGTLTEGVFRVRRVMPVNMSEGELMELAAYAESFSNHPISASLREAYGGDIDASRVSGAEELSGRGVCALIDGKKVLAGNAKLMNEAGILFAETDEAGTVVHVAADGTYAGCVLIADGIKADAKKAMDMLREAGVKRTVMLTGDSNAAAEKAARELCLDGYRAELLPEDKVNELERLLDEKSARSTLVFVGDGINDAPVLARADVGVAMGALGSDAAIEAADVVIMTDEPSKLVAAISIARRTLRIVDQNIVLALSVKLIVLALSAIGLASMWGAVLADVGVAVLATLNALRTLAAGKA